MSTLVVIPTFNERDNLPTLVREVMRLDGFSVLVVDDQSPDGTGEVADRLAREFAGRVDVLHRTGKRGFGLSYVEALLKARDLPYEFVCQMDADLSHDPKYLPDLVAAGRTGFGLVVGSRYLQGVSVVNWPLRRLILSTFANAYIRAITRVPVRDCTGGFRCWRREWLGRIGLERITSDGYSFQVEMLYEAHRQGCRIGEVPIIFVERRAGASKLSTSVLVESIVTPWRVVLRGLLGGR